MKFHRRCPHLQVKPRKREFLFENDWHFIQRTLVYVHACIGCVSPRDLTSQSSEYLKSYAQFSWRHKEILFIVREWLTNLLSRLFATIGFPNCSCHFYNTFWFSNNFSLDTLQKLIVSLHKSWRAGHSLLSVYGKRNQHYNKYDCQKLRK